MYLLATNPPVSQILDINANKPAVDTINANVSDKIRKKI